MNVRRVPRHQEDLMLERQAKFVEDRFFQTERNMATLCSVFSDYTRRTAKYRDSVDQMAEIMRDFSSKEQINKTLKQSMEQLSQCFTLMGHHRDNSTQFLEEQLMTSLTQYGLKCKRSDLEIKKIYAAKDKEMAKRRQLTKIRQRLPQNVKVLMKAEGDLVQATSQVAHLQDSLEEYALSFEMSKLSDTKKMLHDFVKAELVFHVRAVECLSLALTYVGEINVKADHQSFKDVLLHPNKAIRLDIVRNSLPVHRVGIPRHSADITQSAVTERAPDYVQQTSDANTENTSGPGNDSFSKEFDDETLENDESDQTDEEASPEDERSSTIHVKPSAAFQSRPS